MRQNLATKTLNKLGCNKNRYR